MKTMLPMKAARLSAAVKFLVLSTLFIFLFNSCKKDSIATQEIAIKEKSGQTKVEIETITLETFGREFKIDSLSQLRNAILSNKSGKANAAIQLEGSSLDLEFSGKVRVIRSPEGVSYVFPLKPLSPTSLSFQNLTVDRRSDRTLVFINTYTPTEKWVNNWIKGKNAEFEGKIEIVYLDPKTLAQKYSAGRAEGSRAVMSSGTICLTTRYYYTYEQMCVDNIHAPGEPGCVYAGSDDAAYLRIGFHDNTDCTTTGGGSSNPGDGSGSTPPNGGGGTTPTPPDGYDPCASGEIKCTAPGGGSTPAQQLATQLDITDIRQITFLDGNASLVTLLNNYLNANGNSIETGNFIRWVVAYLTVNKNVVGFDVNREAELLTFKEGSDLGTPTLDWDSYTLPQQKQPMPTFATIKVNWPYTEEAGTGFAISTAKYVYDLVGGQLGAKYGLTDYRNACAIRGSVCLNNSGYPIPQISGTEKGANNKNFILRAVDFRNYVNNHFEGPKARLNVSSTTTKQQIMDWLKENGGRSGIYIAINKNASTAGYSGHVDLIVNGLVINGYEIDPKGGLSYIEIW